MGSNASTPSSSEPNRTKALVAYDENAAREARTHAKSDFVDPRSLVDHLQPGDLIQKKGNRIEQWFYSHFAVYIGNGEIVHVTGDKSDSSIKRESLTDAFRGEVVRKNNLLDDVWSPGSSREIVRTAREWVGKQWAYNLLTHNCEHFAALCRYGREMSLQGFAYTEIGAGKLTFYEYVYFSLLTKTEPVRTFVSWIKRMLANVPDDVALAVTACGEVS